MAVGDARVPRPLNTFQKVSYSTATATTNAINANCNKILVYASTNAFYAIGSAPVATVAGNGTFLPAGDTHLIRVQNGQKVSFIHEDGATAGTGYVSEMDD